MDSELSLCKKDVSNCLYKTISTKSDHLFSEKNKNKYSYNEVFEYAITSSTYRAFHKKPTSSCGAKEVFKDFFLAEKKNILEKIKTITKSSELNAYEKELYEKLKAKLSVCIKEEKLKSYNRIRKLIDLFFEHLIIMCEDVEQNTRDNLKKILFLPLDSHIFSSKYVFTNEELTKLKLKRNMSFGEIKDEKKYDKIQESLLKKAGKIKSCISKDFFRIYFDLFWGNRYQKELNYLFIIENDSTNCNSSCCNFNSITSIYKSTDREDF